MSVFSRKDAKSAKEFKFLGSITKNGDFLCDLGVLGERKFSSTVSSLLDGEPFFLNRVQTRKLAS